jgi:hypothetical protein
VSAPLFGGITSPSLPAGGSQLSEREWDKLINIILEGYVVPVIGQELLITNQNGREEPLYDVWGRILAEQAGMAIPEDDGTPALYRVTNQLSQTQNRNDLAIDVDYVIRRQPWPIPESLRKLAEIRSFSLYVTTTVDHLLKAALEEGRPEWKGQHQDITFTLHGDKKRNDLPEDFDIRSAPALFHLFGATSPFPNAFAKTEDDLIDFSASLLDGQYSPERFFDYLQKKTVLLIGCSFPDWLGRFFIRALNANRDIETINIYYVSGRRQEGLEGYLRRKRARVLVSHSPVTFVDELHRRWEQRREEQAGPQAGSAMEAPFPPLKRGAVFLSYAKEDLLAVQRMRAQLEAANIDTWMDERGLEPGSQFQQVIRESIRNASFFISVISQSLANKEERFLWKEWKWAEDASLERRRDQRFLQPVVIDNTPFDASFVDPPYRDLHWTSLRNGQLPEEFIEFLSQGIRSFRRGK